MPTLRIVHIHIYVSTCSISNLIHPLPLLYSLLSSPPFSLRLIKCFLSTGSPASPPLPVPGDATLRRMLGTSLLLASAGHCGRHGDQGYRI